MEIFRRIFFPHYAEREKRALEIEQETLHQLEGSLLSSQSPEWAYWGTFFRLISQVGPPSFFHSTVFHTIKRILIGRTDEQGTSYEFAASKNGTIPFSFLARFPTKDQRYVMFAVCALCPRLMDTERKFLLWSIRSNLYCQQPDSTTHPPFTFLVDDIPCTFQVQKPIRVNERDYYPYTSIQHTFQHRGGARAVNPVYSPSGRFALPQPT